MDIFGVGPAGATRTILAVGDVARFADRNRFASWTGCRRAPAKNPAGRPNPPGPPMRVDMHAHHRDVAATDHRRRPMHMRLTTRRRIRLGTTVGALVTIGLTGAVGFGSAPATATGGPSAAIAATDTDRVPPEIQVPPGNKLVAEFDAQGVQVYQCTAGAWSFLEPAAVLSTRTAAAVHFRGPSWESTQDGSLVEGRSVASSPVAGSIPQLLLQATRTRGDGVFGGVTYIQRLDTTGGVAPTTACTDGQTRGVPYTADYLFYVAA